MDPQNERWPHVDIVREELHRLQTEKTIAEHNARAKHFAELKQSMTGYDHAKYRIRKARGIRDISSYRRAERIIRQRSVSNFTQVMLEKGQRIIDALEQNGGTVTN